MSIFNNRDRMWEIYFLWFPWVMWAMFIGLSINEGSFVNVVEMHAQKGNFLFFIINSIWLWGTVRWIVVRIKKDRKKQVDISLTRVLLVNILAPVMVSLILQQLIENPSVTLISIPLLGVISASINIG